MRVDRIGCCALDTSQLVTWEQRRGLLRYERARRTLSGLSIAWHFVVKATAFALVDWLIELTLFARRHELILVCCWKRIGTVTVLSGRCSRRKPDHVNVAVSFSIDMRFSV